MKVEGPWGYIQVDDEQIRRAIEKAKESPAAKRKAARIINNEARKVVVICQEIAEEDLHRRDDPRRRSAVSRRHGKHLHDSFEIVPAKESDYRPIVRVRNTHPAFKWIDKGTTRHPIPKGDPEGLMAFPWDGPVGRNESLGTKGAFPVDYADAPLAVFPAVIHPGNRAHNILQRAIRRYRRRAQSYRIS